MVVAYGTAKKSAYTGSASVIKADEIEGRMVTDAVSRHHRRSRERLTVNGGHDCSRYVLGLGQRTNPALSGTMAGVQVTQSNGQPGSSPSVRIRGIGTIFGSASPLYVVDGMPFDGDIATG